ncbi:hypothetical protein AK812_SmicGene12709 [Symbiodinium microadriaticum]|uniref:Uncharacterized protein n=1 Tax=Symbiodinium microadriaticum TaxID=2951 RepID=A0A1Q9E9Y4_SYMMI|nr:hypothetical protein AK812_SmicGene12709 [Symbiodinium microadriaticum]
MPHAFVLNLDFMMLPKMLSTDTVEGKTMLKHMNLKGQWFESVSPYADIRVCGYLEGTLAQDLTSTGQRLYWEEEKHLDLYRFGMSFLPPPVPTRLWSMPLILIITTMTMITLGHVVTVSVVSTTPVNTPPQRSLILDTSTIIIRVVVRILLPPMSSFVIASTALIIAPLTSPELLREQLKPPG